MIIRYNKTLEAHFIIKMMILMQNKKIINFNSVITIMLQIN